MTVRPTTPAENARAAELFAIDFRMAMPPGTVAPGGEPGKRRWAAFDEDGEMMASLLLTDYTVHFDGHCSPMAAFGGVNTLPPYRRSGSIRRCFEEILPQLYAEGCEFSYLYPFSTGYYLQFGYERCVQLIRAKVDLLQLKLPKPSGYFRLAEQRNPLLAAVQAVDQVWEQRFNMMVCREEAHYRWLLASDPAVKQEFTYVWFADDRTPKAYTTFRVTDQQNLDCSRFVFADREGFLGLLQIFKSLSADHRYVTFRMPMMSAVQYLLPEWNLGAVQWSLQPHGMVRVIHAQRVLEKAKYLGSGAAVLEIQDPLFPENNGRFAVSFADGKATEVARTDAAADVVLSIGAFSALITGVWDMADTPWLEGIEIRNPAAPLSQIFYKKPLMITDPF